MDEAAQPQCLQVDDGVAAGMRRLGFTEDDIAMAQGARAPGDAAGDAPGDFEVHEDCWKSWLFFLQVQRQWVFVTVSAGMGVTAQRWALDWQGVRAMVLLRRLPPRQWDALVDDLMVIERAVLRAEAETRSDARE